MTAERLEPILAQAFAFHAVGDERLGKALEPLRGEIDKVEEAALRGAPCSRRSPPYPARLVSEGGRQGSVSRQSPHFLAMHPPDQVADYDGASGDAHSSEQRLATGYGYVAHCVREPQARTHRPLGIVLMRHCVLVATDDGAHLLRIEPRRELGRADEIAEQHSQLPSSTCDRVVGSSGASTAIGLTSAAAAASSRLRGLDGSARSVTTMY